MTAQEMGIDGEEILYDNSEDALSVIRHSAAHLLAEAIKKLYPDAKFFVGPVVDEGFYYDFKTEAHISEEDLKDIEKTMKKLAGSKEKFEKYSITKTEALDRYKDDELKTAVLSNIPDENVSFYKQGEFEDLCRGPHVPNTKYLTNVKLTKVAGAYLGGDSSKEMLIRIYGVAFADKDSLKAYVTRMEEALKRDHRKLGNELKLFKFDDEVGAGLPIWLPNGATLRSKLEQLLFKAHKVRGYVPVRGPEMLKADLWRKSGHIQNYGENMYFTDIDEHQYGMKPMNCVGHIKVFESDIRSYRDLPIKYFEYGVVHRHEQSGVLHGLLRVREFTQDDAHIFCTEEQIEEQISDILEFVDSLMKTFNFEYTMELATKPEKAIGEDALWDKATEAIRSALENGSHEFGIDEGGGAFYGPKIDIKITDAIGRKWQCGTVQVDFNLPQRFDLEYVDEDNEKKQPVMIHRAILGSFERFVAILVEHFAGELPFEIAPVNVIIIPVKEEHLLYAKEVETALKALEIDVEINSKAESLNKRIRTSEKQKVPMILVLGDKEVEEKSVALRDRRERTQSEMSLKDFTNLIKEKQNGVSI
ncbi:MAG: threonine--tRNA ligase [Campylobacterales bacterium]|nr:threonine--tRNA ligase [Campylobacterales bacterium]